MKRERTVTVTAEITLSFEVERHKGSGKTNYGPASQSAISALRGYLARYPYGRVVDIQRQD